MMKWWFKLVSTRTFCETLNAAYLLRNVCLVPRETKRNRKRHESNFIAMWVELLSIAVLAFLLRMKVALANRGKGRGVKFRKYSAKLINYRAHADGENRAITMMSGGLFVPFYPRPKKVRREKFHFPDSVTQTCISVMGKWGRNKKNNQKKCLDCMQIFPSRGKKLSARLGQRSSSSQDTFLSENHCFPSLKCLEFQAQNWIRKTDI